MRVAAVADQRPQRRKHQRQTDRQRDPPGWHAELHNHHAVQGAHQQRHGHADGGLKQRQPQQARQWQFNRRCIGKRQVALRQAGQPGGCLEQAFHHLSHSQAWEV